MNNHVASVHEGRKLKCNLCDHSFTEKGSLNRHIKASHEGMKPFKCNICDTSFAQKGNLNNHFLSVHEGKWSATYVIAVLQNKAVWVNT